LVSSVGGCRCQSLPLEINKDEEEERKRSKGTELIPDAATLDAEAVDDCQGQDEVGTDEDQATTASP
jgi:hypothetical protein